MAPARKSESVNKQYLSTYEDSPHKDAGNSRKSKPKDLNGARPRSSVFIKLIENDRKKVAAVVHIRSTEMVEALYSTNQAYLSLPDGTASLIGLIAMMTDHYNVLGWSDGERESNEASDMPRNAQKYWQPKVHLESSKEDAVQPQLVTSGQGCLSLLKRAGFNGFFSFAFNSRQRNTYTANPLLPWQKSPTNLKIFGGLTSSADGSLISLEAGSVVVGEIVNCLRLKAHAMADAALKAVSSVKEDEDAFMRIGEALNSVSKKHITSDIRMPTIKSPEPEYSNGLVSITSKPVATAGWASNPKLQKFSDKNEEQVPSGLITSCVATLLMIQTCAERQYPLADVAQIIDLALFFPTTILLRYLVSINLCNRFKR